MQNLELLTCSPDQSQKLMDLGITSKAFLWHDLEEKDGKRIWDTCIKRSPVISETCLPAWTKAELDAMIGPDIEPKPDVEPMGANGKKEDRRNYYVKFPEKGYNFWNGAQASAAVLIYLLENEVLVASEVVYRYSKTFIY